MAVTNYSGLTINQPQTGIQFTKVTDSSADWASISNSTYFYDKTDKLVHYKDSTGAVLEIFTTMPIPSTSYGLFAQTAVSTPITNTVSELSLIGTGVGTLSVPANSFAVGDSFAVKMCGTLSCANNEDIVFRTDAGTIVLAESDVITLAMATAKHWELVIDFTVTKIGAAGTAEIFVNGQFVYNKNANTALDGVNFNYINNMTFDTTISNTLNITAQWATADLANSINTQNFTLTKTY